MNSSPDAAVEALQAFDAQLAATLTPLLAADAPRAMTDASIIEFTRLIESVGRRVDAARLAAASELGDRSRPDRGEARLSARLGCANAAELLVRLTGVATATSKERLGIAKHLGRSTSLHGDTIDAVFPVIRAAIDAAAIGIDTATAITRTLGPIADRCHPGALAAAEHELVAAAMGSADELPLSADETRIQAKVWALALDPDGALPEYERAARRRGIALGRERDGIVPISGGLLPDVAAQFVRLLDAQLSPRVEDRTLEIVTGRRPVFRPDLAPHADADADADADAECDPDADRVYADPADDPRSVIPQDSRTRAQKQHDALAAILSVAARSAEMPSIGGAAPTLLVTIAASDLARADGVGFVDGTDTTVPALVARHIACCGGIQRLVFSDEGRIIELGSPQRVFTAHQRRAIVARDGGCIIPGCEVPAAWCEIHHATEHSRGGPTHTDNGVLLCWHHHRTLETSGWHVRIVDGVPEVKAPIWMDPFLRWRPARGSAQLQRDRLRRRRRTG